MEKAPFLSLLLLQVTNDHLVSVFLLLFAARKENEQRSITCKIKGTGGKSFFTFLTRMSTLDVVHVHAWIFRRAYTTMRSLLYHFTSKEKKKDNKRCACCYGSMQSLGKQMTTMYDDALLSLPPSPQTSFASFYKCFHFSRFQMIGMLK